MEPSVNFHDQQFSDHHHELRRRKHASHDLGMISVQGRLVCCQRHITARLSETNFEVYSEDVLGCTRLWMDPKCEVLHDMSCQMHGAHAALTMLSS